MSSTDHLPPSGMGLDVAACLVGISTGYLSWLEWGKQRFDRGGLLSALSEALVAPW